jgi:hypothetical protein
MSASADTSVLPGGSTASGVVARTCRKYARSIASPRAKASASGGRDGDRELHAGAADVAAHELAISVAGRPEARVRKRGVCVLRAGRDGRRDVQRVRADRGERGDEAFRSGLLVRVAGLGDERAEEGVHGHRREERGW